MLAAWKRWLRSAKLTLLERPLLAGEVGADAIWSCFPLAPIPWAVGCPARVDFGVLVLNAPSPARKDCCMCCRRGAGAGGASMNTNSTVNVPLMFSVSYGLGCSSRTWVEAGPFDSSSIPTRPSPKNFWKPQEESIVPERIWSHFARRLVLLSRFVHFGDAERLRTL